MFRSLTRTQLVTDVVLAGIFAAIALPLELEAGRASEWNALATALICVTMAGAVAVRRFAPGVSLGLAWTGAIMQMAFSRPPGFSDVAVFGVLYVTAAYGSRLIFWLGFASAIGGALVATSYIFFVLNASAFSLQTLTVVAAVLIASVFAFLLSWTVGALVRTAGRARETRVAQQRAEADAQAEQERVRIARDMHDVVAHSLAVVIAQADGARYAAPADPGAADRSLATISATARAALADVRLLLTQLRHPHAPLQTSSSTPPGASGARGPSQGDGPQPTIADLEELYAQVRAAGVSLAVDIDPAPPGEPPAAVQIAVYRILQEALTNALRHGDRTTVAVHLGWHAGHVDLEVRNRVGAVGSAAAGPGHGLVGMGERAALAGGRLEAEPQDGWFVVRAALPLGVPA